MGTAWRRGLRQARPCTGTSHWNGDTTYFKVLQAQVEGCDHTNGHLLAKGGGVLPGLYGAGLAFAEDETSSGAPYPEASLKAFAARARAIAADAAGVGQEGVGVGQEGGAAEGATRNAPRYA